MSEEISTFKISWIDIKSTCNMVKYLNPLVEGKRLRDKKPSLKWSSLLLFSVPSHQIHPKVNISQFYQFGLWTLRVVHCQVWSKGQFHLTLLLLFARVTCYFFTHFGGEGPSLHLTFICGGNLTRESVCWFFPLLWEASPQNHSCGRPRILFLLWLFITKCQVTSVKEASQTTSSTMSSSTPLTSSSSSSSPSYSQRMIVLNDSSWEFSERVYGGCVSIPNDEGANLVECVGSNRIKSGYARGQFHFFRSTRNLGRLKQNINDSTKWLLSMSTACSFWYLFSNSYF